MNMNELISGCLFILEVSVLEFHLDELRRVQTYKPLVHGSGVYIICLEG